MTQFVPIEQFGKDHWSLFAYVECVAVEKEFLDKRRLRCNANTHPFHNVNANMGVNMKWDPKHGTRLKGYFDSQDPNHKFKLSLPDHDDYDCLNDLEQAGLLEVMGEANAWVVLTDKGMEMASELRIHKQKGGNFSDFTPGMVSATISKTPLDAYNV